MEVLLVLDHDSAHDAGGLIDFLANRHTLDHVPEFDPARLFSDDRDVIRIPLDEGFTLLDEPTVGDGNDRTDNDVVTLEFASVASMHTDGAVLIQHDEVVV